MTMTTQEATLVPPEEFVAPGRRLFLDTNVFMDTDERREGGLKQLFSRCYPAIRANSNPIVVPTKVVGELQRKSQVGATDVTEPIKRARNALVWINSAQGERLVEAGLGDDSNPYPDDLFIEVFRRYAHRYEMCLITNDITLLLRVRLLAAETDRPLLAGMLTKNGEIEVESDQGLFDRGSRKLVRKVRLLAEGLGTTKDRKEVAELEPTLAAFQETFQLDTARAHVRTATRAHRPQPQDSRDTLGAFSPDAVMQAPDVVLPPISRPDEGDEVQIHSARHGVDRLTLGALVGEGGEGRVYAVSGNDRSVVKIFDAEHRTQHRREKLRLLLSRDFQRTGISFPTGLITNLEGEFLGYAMPRASGKELQATVMRPARFRKTYPNWTKADLVDVCISFLEKVAHLHSLNILLGDINPKNVMVDANKDVWIIDADSWQLEGYPCPVGTPMFTAPSVTGDYASALRTEQEELFAVATMLFMILITGQFPYARARADGGDFAALIKEGKFSFQFRGASDKDQPEGTWKYMWSHLPFPVKRLFWNTFHRDGTRYANRPSADEWLRLFREYRRFFGSPQDFDPMSHDVYPTRFRKMAADTPEYQCAACDTSMIGRWQQDRQTYWTPKLCDECRRNQSRCSECDKPKAPEALREGRCRDCNHKLNYAICVACSKDTPRRFLVDGRCSSCQPVPCKQCGSPTPKTALTYGRCTVCNRRAESLDGARLCMDCHQPFITFNHEEWFTNKGLDVPKSHQAIRKACPPNPVATRSPWASPTHARTPAPTPTTRTPVPTPTSPTPAPQSLWERFVAWWNA